MYQYPDYMYHYGIKGMRWGIRKQKISERKKSYLKNRERAKDYKKASKERKNLSDKELDIRIQRLEKEKKLRTLTEEEVNPGRTMVKKQLKKVGATAVVGGIVVGAKWALTGQLNVQEAANYILPNPHKKK